MLNTGTFGRTDRLKPHHAESNPLVSEPTIIAMLDRLAIEAIPLDTMRALRFALLASEMRAALVGEVAR